MVLSAMSDGLDTATEAKSTNMTRAPIADTGIINPTGAQSPIGMVPRRKNSKTDTVANAARPTSVRAPPCRRLFIAIQPISGRQ
jgi:hypothetical protein